MTKNLKFKDFVCNNLVSNETFYQTWNDGSLGFPSMTAHGQAPGLASDPPTIRVTSLRPQDESTEFVCVKGVTKMFEKSPNEFEKVLV